MYVCMYVCMNVRLGCVNACYVCMNVLKCLFLEVSVYIYVNLFVYLCCRGWVSRGTSSMFAAQAEKANAATTIQRIYRGRLGRARLESKRQLDIAARSTI